MKQLEKQAHGRQETRGAGIVAFGLRGGFIKLKIILICKMTLEAFLILCPVANRYFRRISQ
jgi:hypothetical protein